MSFYPLKRTIWDTCLSEDTGSGRDPVLVIDHDHEPWKTQKVPRLDFECKMETRQDVPLSGEHHSSMFHSQLCVDKNAVDNFLSMNINPKEEEVNHMMEVTEESRDNTVSLEINRLQGAGGGSTISSIPIHKRDVPNKLIHGPCTDQVMNSVEVPKESFPMNSFPLFTINEKGCPECAAGKSGHFKHIGRWRLLDS